MAPANPNYAAFFRNVNLGQLSNPSRAQLERAFTAAGAAAAMSFLTNGTIVFMSSSKARAGDILVPVTTRNWNIIVRLVKKYA